MQSASKDQKYYSIQQAARFLKISADTLRRWEREGRLTAERTVGGHRRYSLEDIKKLKTKKFKLSASPEIPDLYSTLPRPQINLLVSSLALLGIMVSLVLTSKTISALQKSGHLELAYQKVSQYIPTLPNLQTSSLKPQMPAVLQASTTNLPVILAVNVPAVFRDTVTFDTGITSEQLATLGDLDIVGTLSLAGQGVDASATELNYLTGITITQGGIVYNTATGLASSAAGSSGQVLTSAGTGTPTWTSPSSLTVGDAGTVDGIDSGSFLRSDTSDQYTSGTLTANSGTTFNIAGTFQVGGTTVTSSAAELNILDGVTSTAGELNFLDGTTVTAGGVVFGDGTKLTQDATNFNWDNTNNSLDLIGTLTVTNGTASNVDVDLTSTGDFTVSTSATPFITFNSNGDIALANDSLLDLSSVDHGDSAAQGFRLPQAASLTAITGGTEGYLAWDTDGNALNVFDGTNWVNLSASSSPWTNGVGVTYLTDTAEDLALGGSTTEAPFYFDVSASALHFNPFGAAAGNTGEVRFEELEAQGDNYTGFKAPDTLAGNVIYSLPQADATVTNQVLASNTAGALSWINVAEGAGSLWDSTGAIVHPTNSTDDVAFGGTDTESELFFDTSAASLSLNPFGVAAGNTGEIRFEELEAGGDNYTGFKAPDALAGNVIYTFPSADATAANQVLASSATGVLSWIDVTSGSGSPWSRVAPNTYLANTTDELIIGGSTPLSSAKVSIDGDTDQIQLLVQGHSDQTTAPQLFLVETSAGSDLFSIDVNGDLALSGEIDINGGSTHDIAGTLNLSGTSLTASGDLTITPAGGDLTVSATLHVGTVNNTSANLTLQTTTTGNIVLTPAGSTVDINAGTLDLSTQTVAVTLNAAENSLNFDSNTLSIDASADEVGIGTSTPDGKLDVRQSGTGDILNLYDGSTNILSVQDGGDVTIGASTQADVDVTLYGDIFQQGNTDLTAITSIKDVYVYDTTKDSDGGAWTNSATTQQLSWYATEAKDDGPGDPCAIATDDRCGRSAFPKKAIIVADVSNVYILDAQDNSLWVKFTQGTSNALGADSTNDPSSVFALDGVIYVGTNNTSGTGLYAFDFKQDKMFNYDSVDRTDSGTSTISARNGGGVSYSNANTAYAINSSLVNDVHAAVIAGKTFIAVATDTDMSIIRPDEATVYDYSHASADDYNTLWLTPTATASASLYALNETKGQLERWDAVNQDTASKIGQAPHVVWDEGGVGRNGAATGAGPALATSAPTIQVSPSSLFVEPRTSNFDQTVYIGTNQGLTVLKDIMGDESNGSVKYYTTTYITEEMVGDIRNMMPFAGTGTLAANTLLTSPDTDVTRRANSWTTSGASNQPVHVSGVRGNALNFDGSDDYVCTGTVAGTCADDTDLDVTGNITIGAWIKRDTANTTDRIIAKLGDAGQRSYWLTADTASTDFVVSDNGTLSDLATLSGALPANTWFFVVGVYDGSALRLYINGVEVNSLAYVDGIFDSSTPVTIGSDKETAPDPFDGTIDEPFVTAEALRPDQIRRMYLVGKQALKYQTVSSTATSGSTTTVTVSGATWTANEFVGSFVEMTSGSANGETRRIVANTGTQLTVSPAFSAAVANTDTFVINPNELYSATNTVKAVTVSDSAPDEIKTLYVGANNDAGGGGVTALRLDGDYVTDLFHGDAGKTDDGGTAWTDTDADYDDIEALSNHSGVLAIGAQDQYWMESTAKSFTEKVDDLSNQVNNAQLALPGLLSDSHRQDDTTNSTVGYQVIRKGWGYIEGDASQNVEETVNYGITYDDLPLLFASASWASDNVPSTLANCNFGMNNVGLEARVNNVAKSSYQANLWASSALSVGDYYCYTWLAIGTYSQGAAASPYAGVAPWANGADIAEWYGTDDETLQAGEVVSIDPSGEIKVVRSGVKFDESAIGIIATQPALVLGPESGLTPGYTSGSDPQGGKSVQVALAGRVPVKVSLEGGPIAAGDPLTTSSTPGVAMKAVGAASIIGKSMENWDGTTTIVALGTQDAVVSGEISEDNPELAKESFEELDNGIGTIMAFVNTSTYIAINENGDLDLGGNNIITSDVTVKADTSLIDRLFGFISGKTQEEQVTQDQLVDNQEQVATTQEQNTQTDLSISLALGKLLDRIETVEGDMELLKNNNILGEATQSGVFQGSSSESSFLYDLTIANSLNIGGISIDAASNSVDAVGTLSLQSLGLGKVDVHGDLEIVDGHITGNETFRGSAALTPGESFVRITPPTPWEKPPETVVVQTTWFTQTLVKDLTQGGFTVEVENPPTKEGKIYWLAIW